MFKLKLSVSVLIDVCCVQRNLRMTIMISWRSQTWNLSPRYSAGLALKYAHPVHALAQVAGTLDARMHWCTKSLALFVHSLSIPSFTNGQKAQKCQPSNLSGSRSCVGFLGSPVYLQKASKHTGLKFLNWNVSAVVCLVPVLNQLQSSAASLDCKPVLLEWVESSGILYTDCVRPRREQNSVSHCRAKMKLPRMSTKRRTSWTG